MCALPSLASVTQGALEDYHVSMYAPAVYSFVLLVNIPFKEYTRICSFIHLLMGHAGCFWFLVWRYFESSSYELLAHLFVMLSFLLGKYLGVDIG